MQENFVKLKHKFKVGPYLIKDLRVLYGKKINNTPKGIWYSDVEFENKNQIFNVIPERYRKYFSISLMEVNVSIPPHIDTGILTTINFYISTNDCVTQFYKFKDVIIKKMQVKNQANGSLFNLGDLDITGKFKAEDEDVYLLDVSKPHSIIQQSENSIHRTAICLQSKKFGFNEVIKMLLETNNI